MPNPTATGPNGEKVEWNGSAWVPVGSAAPQPGSSVILGQRAPDPPKPDPRPASPELAQAYNTTGIIQPSGQYAVAPAGSNPETILAGATARARAQRDVKRIEDAGNAATEGAGLQAQARSMEAILERGAPTGFMGETRLNLGTAVGDTLGWMWGIPDSEETRELSAFNRVASGLTLENVGQLKGPLSEKELAFIQRLSPSINDKPAANLDAARALEWAGQRAVNYEAALSAWTERLGSPSARNSRGQSFDGWWATWSANRMPAPWEGRAPAPPTTAPARRRGDPREAERREPKGVGSNIGIGNPALATAQANARMFEDMARRSRPGPPRRAPARATAAKPIDQLSDEELARIARGG